MKKFFSAIVVAITLFLLSTCCVLAQQPNNNSPNVKDDSLRRTIDEIKELLVKHYDPMIPIANYQPSVKARFEPIEFNSCDLWWKLIAPLSKNSSYVLDIHMNLADLNPNSVVVSADLKRKNRWFISLQTLNMTPKIKVKRVTLNGARANVAGTFASPQVGFDADGEENAQKMVDAFTSAIKQCSQK